MSNASHGGSISSFPSPASHLPPPPERFVKVQHAQISKVRHASDGLERVKSGIGALTVVLQHET